MEQRRSEVDSGSDSQQIAHSLRKPKFHDFIHKSLPVDPARSQQRVFRNHNMLVYIFL
jgi:hypothetical protein